jgi:predicted ATPase
MQLSTLERGFHLFLRSVTLLREKIADFQTYPFTVPAIRELEFLHFDSPVTFFVGENGSGKSTLLEAIAYQCGFNTAGETMHMRWIHPMPHWGTSSVCPGCQK